VGKVSRPVKSGPAWNHPARGAGKARESATALVTRTTPYTILKAVSREKRTIGKERPGISDRQSNLDPAAVMSWSGFLPWIEGESFKWRQAFEPSFVSKGQESKKNFGRNG